MLQGRPVGTHPTSPLWGYIRQYAAGGIGASPTTAQMDAGFSQAVLRGSTIMAVAASERGNIVQSDVWAMTLTGYVLRNVGRVGPLDLGYPSANTWLGRWNKTTMLPGSVVTVPSGAHRGGWPGLCCVELVGGKGEIFDGAMNWWSGANGGIAYGIAPEDCFAVASVAIDAGGGSLGAPSSTVAGRWGYTAGGVAQICAARYRKGEYIDVNFAGSGSMTRVIQLFLLR